MKKVVLAKIQEVARKSAHIFEAREYLREIDSLVSKLHYKSANDLEKVLDRLNSIHINALSLEEINRGLGIVTNMIEERAIGDIGIHPKYLAELLGSLEMVNSLRVNDLSAHITDPSIQEEYTNYLNHLEFSQRAAKSLLARLK